MLPEATYVEVPGTHMSSVTKPDLGVGLRGHSALAEGENQPEELD